MAYHNEALELDWQEVSQERYDEMLNVLPPIRWQGSAFLVGEPVDHDPETGRATYDGFIKIDGHCFATKRAVTEARFRGMISEAFNTYWHGDSTNDNDPKDRT